MKLDNLRINLSSVSFNDNPILNSTNLINGTENQQSTIYYESGIPEIDSFFKDSPYYMELYVFRIMTLIDGITLCFVKYDNQVKKDAGYIDIHRSDIINFEESNDINFEILQNDAKSRKLKRNLGYGFGVVGTVIAHVADSNRKIKTKYVNGSRFKLNYKDKDGEQQCVIVYSPEEYKHETLLFLNTYYKNELSEEAKIPAQTDSSCFIATACYKDIYSPEVVFFRWYRDNIMNHSYLGKRFVNLYYKFSPLVYKFIARHNKISEVIKAVLNKIYSSLSTKHGR